MSEGDREVRQQSEVTCEGESKQVNERRRKETGSDNANEDGRKLLCEQVGEAGGDEPSEHFSE